MRILTFIYYITCVSWVCRAEIFEFEDALTDAQQQFSLWRSEASNNKTLRIVDPNAKTHMVHLTLCIEPVNNRPNVSILVANVRYSNDGPEDSVIFRLEGNYLGHFSTGVTWGNGVGWNVFKSSGIVAQKVFLKRGRYRLTVAAITDSYGVELDSLRIRAENQHPSLGLVCRKSFTQ